MAERVVGVGIVGGLMGREFASAAARLGAPRRHRRPAAARRSVRHEPGGARVVRATRSRLRGRRATTASCSPTAPSRLSTARCRTPARGDLHRGARGGQAPARREAVRHRPGRERGDQPRDRPDPSYSSVAPPSCRSIRAGRRSPAGSPSAASAACSRCARSFSTRATSTPASRSTGSESLC